VLANYGGSMTERLDLDALQEKDGLNKDLGIEYVELEVGRVVMSMPVDARHHQPLGYLHGGASVVLAESVATVGTPVQVGRKEQVWEVHIHDEDEKPVCVSRCRLAVVDAED
jgi:1,4-dihydroxy-2-naphthoyl-CoA hydrolase